MQYIEIGKTVNTHGVRGELKIYTYTDDIEALRKLKTIYITMKDGSLKDFKVCGTKVQKNMLIVKLDTVDTVEDANMLRDLIVQRERKPNELDEDTFYIVDLIGLQVYEDTGELLGVLEDVIQPGANDVYVVKMTDGKEILLPVIKQVVKDIDLENKRITVHVMEGLR
ncbi:MAG: ribosome maturation factor RimM [Clostridia bacterium]